MTKNDQDEKQDEKDEKEMSKREEKTFEEKWNRDRLSALVWASILIWAGVVLLASNLGAFDLIEELIRQLPFQPETFPFEIEILPSGAWSAFWLGAALILFVEAAIRLIFPTYRRSILGTLILAVVFLGLGLGNWMCVWPLILIAIGVSILFRNLGNKE